MKTKSFKIFTFIMAILMLFVYMPMYSFATLIENNSEATEEESTEIAKQDVIVLEENKELRDENIKHFKLSDGTTKAVVYSQAVHYLDENGNWIDIDNALTLNGSEYSSNNKQTVKFANKSGSNGLVSIKDGDYKIDFTPLNTNKVKVEIENPQKNNSRKFEDMSQLDNLISKAIYKNIYDKTDIEYILIGNNLKENIIVKEKQDSYTFSFELKLNKLSAELVDGAIILSDYDTGDKVYEIPAPYMLDANNIYSNSVEYSLVQDSKWKYTFTVTADSEWINAEERAFPVTIDPMIYTESNITDTFFGNDNYDYGSHSYLSIGDFWSLDCFAFVKYGTLPSIPTGAVITDARISIYAQGMNNTTNLNVAAYRVTNSWTSTTPHATAKEYFDNNTLIDHIKINSHGVYEWDITELFKQWKSGVANHGVAFGMMEFNGTDDAFVQFSSSENQSYTKPKLQVSYTTITGLENYYSYYQSSADMAGTGYVNAFTGNLTFVHDIFTTADEIMPFSLYATYNSNTKNWRLNTDETVEAIVLENIQYYKWTDGDGTEHWFSPIVQKNAYGDFNFYEMSPYGDMFYVTNPTEFYNQDGLGLKITISDGKIIMSDDKGNQKTFVNGKISSISDTYGNKREFAFYDDGKAFISLKPNGLSSVIQQISIVDLSTDIIITNIQTGIKSIIELSEDANRIEKIIYDYGNSQYCIIEYEYSTEGYLVLAKNQKNNLGTQYTYTNGKVTSVTEIANAYSETVSTGNTMSISYGTLSSTTRIAGADNVLNNGDDIFSTYRFDGSGRVVTAYSHDNSGNIFNSSSYQYNDMYKDEGVGPKLHNSVKTSFVNGSSTPNYLYNGAFENGITGWTQQSTGSVYVDIIDGYDTFDAIDYGNVLIIKAAASNKSTVKQSVYLTSGTYTLSATMLREQMLSDATLKFKILNSSNAVVASSDTIRKLENSYSFKDWEKEAFTFNISSSGTYTVAIEYTEGASPTISNRAIIDEVMLEKSTGNGTFSAYGNGGFEASLYTEAEKANATLSTTLPLQGNKSLMLIPSLTNEAYYKETYNVCGDYYASDHYVISAWAKADAVPSSETGKSSAKFGIELKVYYENVGEPDNFYIPFETDVTNWQYVSKAITISPKENDGISGGQVRKIEIYLRYDYNYGSAYFDNVCFSRSGTVTNYSYNGLGNINKIGDSNGNITTYNYGNGNAYDVTSVTDKYGRTTSASYDTNHNLKDSTYNGSNTEDTTDDVTSQYERNDFGQITKTTIRNSDSTLQSITSSTYVTSTTESSFSRVETTTDVKGKVTTYKYNDIGLLETVYYDNEDGIMYEYNAYGQLTSAIPIKYNASTDTVSIYETTVNRVNYTYNSKLQLQKIDANTDYTFAYDDFRNMISFLVNGNELAQYEYIQNNGNLKKLSYGNDHYVEYTYDSLDRIIAVCYNGIEKATYTYTPNGEVYNVTDLENGITYQYSYDGKGVILNERAMKDGKTHYNKSYDYDEQGRIIEKRITLPESNTDSYCITYEYNDDGSIHKTHNLYIGLSNTYNYDVIGRLTTDTLSYPSETLIEKNYYYQNYTVNGKTNFSSNIQKVQETINGIEYSTSYTYDEKGNITRIYYSFSNATSKNIYYQYDSQNQLVREDNQILGYTYIYNYDLGGNLISKYVYSYTRSTPDISSLLYYDEYYYNSIWKDMREGYCRYTVSSDGNTLITTYMGYTDYDSIGNPLSYYNGTSYSFTWQNGRQLASATVNGSTYTYKYNQDGIRLSKQYGNTLVEYILDGTKIIYERVYNTATGTPALTSETIYSYDSMGTPNGARIYVYNGTTTTTYDFFFRTSIQGDVLAIFDGNTKAQVVSFNYDAWGNYTTTASNATLSQIALNYTHLRYRGYYQDSETGFYYLNSRYYDAKMCRFINADGVISSANGDLQGYNMFAYCFNNPVNMSDQSGNWPVWLEFLIGVGSKSKIQQTKTSKYIKEKIIQPIAEDVENFDINNTDEEVVFKSNFFSSYKGTVVVKTPFDASFSFGFIGLSVRQQNSNDLNHEYGHKVQLDNMGWINYIVKVARPSITANILDRIDMLPFDYYSSPWENEADINGGVIRPTFKDPWTESDGYFRYLIHVFFGEVKQWKNV